MIKKANYCRILIIGLIILTNCAIYRKPLEQDQSMSRRSRLSSFRFEKSDLSKMQLSSYISMDSDTYASVYVGDVRGDREKEIVLVMEDIIYIYSLQGELLDSRSFDDMNFGEAILVDIDGDGKKDIVLGAAEDKGVSIYALSGLLAPLLEFQASHINNAETKIHFFEEGNIYFSASSSTSAPPNVTGAYNVEKEKLLWKYYTGPVPIDMAANRDLTLLTISNRPVNARGLNYGKSAVADHSMFRSSFYLLEPDGKVIHQVSTGPREETAEFIEGGISSLTKRLYDINGDGEDELVIGVNRLSEFHKGNTALEVWSLGGLLLNRREFLPATELEFSFYSTGEGKETAVLLKQKGSFHILDSDLHVLHEWNSPGIQGEGVLHGSGDFNGDGSIDHLLSIGNYLFILNNRLETLFSTAFTSDIRNAIMVPDQRLQPVLLVQADLLHIFVPEEGGYGSATVHTYPPGAELFIDGTDTDFPMERGIIQKLPAGPHTFQARIGSNRSERHIVTIEEGRHSHVELYIKDYHQDSASPPEQLWAILPEEPIKHPLMDWSDIRLKSRYRKQKQMLFVPGGYQDFAGGPENDFLFRLQGSRILKTCSVDMKLLSQFEIPRDGFIIAPGYPWPDITGNGKSEILLFRQNRQELYIFNAGGKLLGYKKFFDLRDSVFRPQVVYKDGKLYIAVSSGYSGQPRGIMGVDMTSLEAIFFYPTAAMTTGLLISPDRKILPAIYNPKNGSAVTYANGDVVVDSEYFIHMSDLRGIHLPRSFNPDLDENSGHLRYFTADFENDGSSQTYMLSGKTMFRKGTSIIAALDTQQGSISAPLFSAGQNTEMRVHSLARFDDKQVLVVSSGLPGELFLLSKEFVPVRSYNLIEKGNPRFQDWIFRDLDGNGYSEIFALQETHVSIYDLDFNLLFRIESDKESGYFRNLLLDDKGSEGKTDLIIISDWAVSTYIY